MRSQARVYGRGYRFVFRVVDGREVLLFDGIAGYAYVGGGGKGGWGRGLRGVGGPGRHVLVVW